MILEMEYRLSSDEEGICKPSLTEYSEKLLARKRLICKCVYGGGDAFPLLL